MEIPLLLACVALAVCRRPVHNFRHIALAVVPRWPQRRCPSRWTDAALAVVIDLALTALSSPVQAVAPWSPHGAPCAQRPGWSCSGSPSRGRWPTGTTLPRWRLAVLLGVPPAAADPHRHA
jgi:hypothetical protein